MDKTKQPPESVFQLRACPPARLLAVVALLATVFGAAWACSPASGLHTPETPGGSATAPAGLDQQGPTVSPGGDPGGPPKAEWLEVERLIEEQKFQAASEVVRELLRRARSTDDPENWTRALIELVELETGLHGYETAVRLLRDEPWPDDPLSIAALELYYAHGLVRYLQVYSWEIRQREQVVSAEEVDLRAWTAEEIFTEADRAYARVWGTRAGLGEVELMALSRYLEPNNYPAGIRGTLRDAVTYLWVDLLADSSFWSARESNEAFRLNLEELLAAGEPIGSLDLDDHPAVLLSKILGDLEQWHVDAGRAQAASEARLERFRRLDRIFSQTEDQKRIVAALRSHLDELGRRHPWWSMGMSLLAEFVRGSEDPWALVEARRIALEGAQAHPKSVGAGRCRHIVATIEAPTFSVTSMSTDGAQRRSIQVEHKNLDTLHFRAFELDLFEVIRKSRDYSLLPSYNEVADLIARLEPAASWSARLPATPDYRQHRTFLVPELEQKGFYLIVASAGPTFDPKETELQAVYFNRSDAVIVSRRDRGKLEVTVVSGASGDALSGVDVHLHRYSYDRKGHRRVALERTGTDGRVVFDRKEDGNGYFLVAQRGEDVALDEDRRYFSAPRRERDVSGSFVYTDRSIYRPGQQIQWKVVGYRGAASNGDFQVLADEKVSVELHDANGETVAGIDGRSNEYGSFSGAFDIPAGRLLGNWSLETSLDGRAFVLVEEYKRPTFEATLDAPEQALRLNREASVSGEARYYFGLPVVDGVVNWRVTREPVYPNWWWWFYSPRQTSVQEIASGTVELDENGAFEFGFLPEADEREAENGVSYRFRIVVEVTDSGGETATSERSLRLGFVAVDAQIDSRSAFFVAGESPEFVLQRRDLDGAPRAGEGSWHLTRLEQPGRAPLPADIPLPESSPAESSGKPAFETPGDRLRARWHGLVEAPEILRRWQDAAAEVASGTVRHGDDGAASLELEPLQPGAYRLHYSTRDAFGAEFETRLEFVVAEPAGGRLAVPLLLSVEEPSVAVGGTARVLVHSGLDHQRMVLEVFRKGERVRQETLNSASGLQILELPVTPADRGGLGLRLTAVRDHQVMTLSDSLFVPWDEKKLSIEFETFRDLLRPGGRETWRVKVTGVERDLAEGSAELLAYMYDRSLDVFAAHSPPNPLSLYPGWEAPSSVSSNLSPSSPVWSAGKPRSLPGYPGLRGDRLAFYSGYGIGGMGRRDVRRMMTMQEGLLEESIVVASAAPAPRALKAQGYIADFAELDDEQPSEEASTRQASSPSEGSGLRTDFSETAFWHPHLLLEADGSVAFEFEVPDSVTQWNVWVHGLTKDLRAGQSTRQARTVKELLVRPYLPRFLREGDRAELRVVVQNAGDENLSGELEFTILDPETGDNLDRSFSVPVPKGSERNFSLAPGQSWTYSVPVVTPARIGEVAFQVRGQAGAFADGELRPIPILPGRMHLTQSRFVTLIDSDRKTMHFADLAGDGDPSRIDEQLVVTLDAQLFYSVLSALPYLVNYPYECTEQTLNRFLSTGIVSTLYDGYPAVKRMAREFSERETQFDPWRADDPNRKMALEETPWVGLSKGGREAEADLINVLVPEVARAQRKAALSKLEKAQTAIGGFPWFPGGPPSPYMTLYLLNGFSRALEFGLEVPEPMVRRAWSYMHRHYLDRLVEDIIQGDCCWEFVTFLNYVLSSYPDESWTGGVFTQEERQRMLAFSFEHWRLHSPMSKAQLALTLERVGRSEDARLVFDSVMDSAKTTEELGTYWAPEERAWLWYNDTIESHSFALRTLSELDPDDSRRAGLVQWLLLNKKLNHWKSTRATAEVIYSLVHYLEQEGTLAVREEISVGIGEREPRVFVFEPEQYTGRNNQIVIPGDDVDPATDSTVVVDKATPGLAFASATWHFSTEKLPEEARGDFFEARRKYFRRVSGEAGWRLEPLAEGARVEVGDQVEVHISIRARHSAEYVHLRDPRPAGFEPERSTSGYRWDLGLARYEEVRDSGMNFFFERLPVGEYTMKHRLRAATAGIFQAAPATLQSMYAPEFTAYSAGEKLTIAP